MMPVPVDQTHNHPDNAASIIRYLVTDGVHTHIHRIHTTVAATPVGQPEPAIPPAGFYIAETSPYEVMVNFFRYLSNLYPPQYTLNTLDARPVSAGASTQPAQPIPTYSVGGGGGPAAPSPACQVTLTFRDKQGAPCSVRAFQPEGSIWNPAAKTPINPSFAGGATNALAAYLLGKGGVGAGLDPTAPATTIVSHNGQPFAIALAVVSTLNNRLRREYKLK